MNLNDLLSHYARTMPSAAMRQMEQTIRLFGERHLRDLPRPPLREGDFAPDLKLDDEAGSGGAELRLAELYAGGPVVVKFYRGRWCPYCTLELRAWQRCLPRLRGLGGTMVAVSPQSPAQTELTRLRDCLTMRLVSDAGSRIARQFGVAYDLLEEERRLLASLGVDLAAINSPSPGDGGGNCSLALPALYVVGRDGRIEFSFIDVDYRNRAEPQRVLEAIAALGNGPGLSRPGRVPGSCG